MSPLPILLGASVGIAAIGVCYAIALGVSKLARPEIDESAHGDWPVIPDYLDTHNPPVNR